MITLLVLQALLTPVKDTSAFLRAVPAIIDVALTEFSVSSGERLAINTMSFAVLGSEVSDEVVTRNQIEEAIDRDFEDVEPGSSVTCSDRRSSQSTRECQTFANGLYVGLSGLLRMPMGYEVTLVVKKTRNNALGGRGVSSRIIRFVLRYGNSTWSVENRTVVAQAVY